MMATAQLRCPHCSRMAIVSLNADEDLGAGRCFYCENKFDITRNDRGQIVHDVPIDGPKLHGMAYFKVVARKMALDAVPKGEGDPLGASVRFLTNAKAMTQGAGAAQDWLDAQLKLIREAGDTREEEVVCGDILAKLEEKLRHGFQPPSR